MPPKGDLTVVQTNLVKTAWQGRTRQKQNLLDGSEVLWGLKGLVLRVKDSKRAGGKLGTAVFYAAA